MSPEKRSTATPDLGAGEGIPVCLEVELPATCREGANLDIPFRVTNRGEDTLVRVELDLSERTLRHVEGEDTRATIGAVRPGATVIGLPLLIRPRREGGLPLVFRLGFEVAQAGSTIAVGSASIQVDSSTRGLVLPAINVEQSVRGSEAAVISKGGSNVNIHIQGPAADGVVARQWQRVPLEVNPELTDSLRGAAAAELSRPSRGTDEAHTAVLRWKDKRGPVLALVAMGRRLCIGRTCDCAGVDVPLGRLAVAVGAESRRDLISRVHATVQLASGGVSVEDLKSTNGVYIEGVRIPANDPHTLSSGKTLAFSQKLTMAVEILVDTAKLARRSRDVATSGSVLDFARASANARLDKHVAGVRFDLNRFTQTRRRAWVVLLHAAAQVSIGSRHGNALTIQADGVADFHARLLATSGGLAVVDLGSREGTCVNGVRLEANHPESLRYGDHVTVGDTSIDVRAVQDL